MMLLPKNIWIFHQSQVSFFGFIKPISQTREKYKVTMKLFVILSLAASSLAFSPSVQLPQVSTRATVHIPVALDASTVPSMNQNVFEEVSGEVIEPSYYLTWSFALMGAGIIAFHPCKYMHVAADFPV